MKRFIFLLLFLALSLFFASLNYLPKNILSPLPKTLTTTSFSPTKTPTPTPLLTPLQSKILENDYHIFQTFNNCGPAALSMALSYFGINESQQTLGQALRPYQNPQGDNDDKSVTLDELGQKSKEYGLIPYHRPNGNIELIKLFITYDIPVIARTLTKVNEDIGHYRVIKGYDDLENELIQDDSLQGKNLRYSFELFNKLWENFNFEYLVFVPQEKKDIAEIILGENKDTKIAWENALLNAQKQLEINPNNIYARFNLSIAAYYVGDFQKSVGEFEKVEDKLPFRTLWYQIEPILAYQKLKNYNRVFELTDKILNNHNRAFSELYQIRGEIYQEQGKETQAQEEFAKAIFYNKNFLLPQTLDQKFKIRFE